jgi:tetratricopeptide (TPR) repeat protein
MTFAAFTLFFVVARAGGPVPVGAKGDRALETGAATAEDLFRRAVAAYDSGQYDLAIELFRKSYGRARDPAILFNIARAYRALGDCAKSLENLDAFLEVVSPDDPLAARARANRKEISVCVEEQRSVTPGPVLASPAAPVTLATVPSLPPPAPGVALGLSLSYRGPVRSAPLLMTSVCHATVGSTVTLALAEVALLLTTHRLAERIDAATVWTDDLQRDDDQRATLGTVSVLTGVALGVSTTAALGSCWVHWHRAHPSADTR